MEGMSFGEALTSLDYGASVCRKGWNGKGMWLFKTPEEAVNVPHKFGGGYRVQSIIWMKTVDDTIVPWLCSQTDMQAADWMEVMPRRQDQLTKEA